MSALRAVLPAEASVANPVDMLGGATAGTYATVLPHLLADPHIAAVIVLFVPAVSATAEAVAAAVEEAARNVDGDKPVLAVIMSAAGMPAALRGSQHVVAFTYPESAARALGRVADRAEWLRRPQGAVPTTPDGIDRARAEAVVASALAGSDDTWLDPAATRELLLAYGVPLVPERVARPSTRRLPRRASSASPASSRPRCPGRTRRRRAGSRSISPTRRRSRPLPNTSVPR